MVMDYSRRGSGESGDTLPYDVYREIEDLAALINIVQARAGEAAGSVDAARQVKDLLAIGTVGKTVELAGLIREETDHD
jgi:hypothetical protein